MICRRQFAGVVLGVIAVVEEEDTASHTCEVMDDSSNTFEPQARSSVARRPAYVFGVRVSVTCDFDKFCVLLKLWWLVFCGVLDVLTVFKQWAVYVFLAFEFVRFAPSVACV